MENPSSPTHRPLNQKQKHFLDRYHITGQLGQSWLDAGYNCSLESASSNAGRVLQREDAREYLAGLQQYDREKSGCTREMIIERFKQILFSDTARDRDVILAGKEIARMIGAYQQPEKKAEQAVDTLNEFIKRIRNGDHLEEKKEEAPEPEGEFWETYVVPRQFNPNSSPILLPRYDDLEDDGIPYKSRALEAHEKERREFAERDAARQAKRKAEERDPDWHPLYNPHYDPTIKKDKDAKVILPCGR